MTKYTLTLLLISSTLLTGCKLLERFEKPQGIAVRTTESHSAEYREYITSTPRQGKQTAAKVSNRIETKRINTTECNDSDDWYLDGYRVGKSFATQKQQMFQQRVSYCRFTKTTLPTQFKQNWERGFSKGTH